MCNFPFSDSSPRESSFDRGTQLTTFISSSQEQVQGSCYDHLNNERIILFARKQKNSVDASRSTCKKHGSHTSILANIALFLWEFFRRLTGLAWKIFQSIYEKEKYE